MEVNKLWKDNDVNKYYIISLDKETNEWKFFKEIVGHTVFWKDEPSRYGMTKSKAIEVLNIVKSLTNEDIKPEPETPTETEPESGTTPTTPTENEGESGTTPTDDNGTTTPTEGETTPTEPNGEDNTDTPTEPSEGNTGSPTDTSGETSTGENESGETASTDDTEPNTPSTEPETLVEPTTPSVPTEEPQYKIITISSVTYNSTEVAIFDDADYHKLKTTLTYLVTTYPNNNIYVAVTETDTGKSIFYFYLEDELTWFLELKTNINYALVSNVATLDDIKALL